jgi:hypothetical protein
MELETDNQLAFRTDTMETSFARKATHKDTNMYHTIHHHVRSPYHHTSKLGKNTQNYWGFGNLQGKNSLELSLGGPLNYNT